MLAGRNVLWREMTIIVRRDDDVIGTVHVCMSFAINKVAIVRSPFGPHNTASLRPSSANIQDRPTFRMYTSMRLIRRHTSRTACKQYALCILRGMYHPEGTGL